MISVETPSAIQITDSQAISEINPSRRDRRYRAAIAHSRLENMRPTVTPENDSLNQY